MIVLRAWVINYMAAEGEPMVIHFVSSYIQVDAADIPVDCYFGLAFQDK